MLTVKIIPNDKGNPPGKLADAEIHFSLDSDQPSESARSFAVLSGLKLIGFAIWERRGSSHRNVTFPARQYSVNGERRSFALLRPAGTDLNAQDRVRDLILQAYAEHEASADHYTITTHPATVTARETPTPAAPARTTPTPAPFQWADADPESYPAYAAEMLAGMTAGLAGMTASELHGVAFGLFPAEAMRRAADDGYRDSQRLTVALMDAAKAHTAKTPAPTATPATPRRAPVEF